MQRYGVRPSVCLSRSPAAAACGGFAAVRPAARRYRSIAARPVPQQHGPQHGAQQQMRAVPRLQLTQEAEFRFVAKVKVKTLHNM